MVPSFDASSTIPILEPAQTHDIKHLILEDRAHWQELIQQGNYKLTASKQKYQVLYQQLVSALSSHLNEKVVPKTLLDFFLFDKFDERWEKEPSGFIHNDWGNYSKCMQEFASQDDIPFYNPSHAIALVLAITLPDAGSGIELYDAFHGEDISAKMLLQHRANKTYSLREYKLGHATLFCPFQFHSGHCADEGTLKTTDQRMVLVAFLIKYEAPDNHEWHMFRMCKGATLEYGDEALYGFDDDILEGR